MAEEDDEPEYYVESWSDIGCRYTAYGCFSCLVILVMLATVLGYILWLTRNVEWPW